MKSILTNLKVIMNKYTIGKIAYESIKKQMIKQLKLKLERIINATKQITLNTIT